MNREMCNRLVQKINLIPTIRDDMIYIILKNHATDDEATLRERLKSFWALAYSHGEEIGKMDGWLTAQENPSQPLGQIAHLN